MKPNKPIIMPIPDLLIRELHKYLEMHPPNFKYQIVYFYYTIHYLTTASLQNKNKFIPINSKYLQSVTVWNIGRYIQILKNGEFIISDDHYIPGEKSLHYKVNPEYLIGTTFYYEVKPDSRMFKKIIKRKRNSKAHDNRLEPFLKRMKKFFMEIDFDYVRANKWIDNKADEGNKHSYRTALYMLQDKRFRYFKRNKTNSRLDTNLTSLKTDLRQFIIGDLVSIDLKNSQPFFLSQFLVNLTHMDKQQPKVTLCYRLGTLNPSGFFGMTTLSALSKIHQKCKKAKMVNLNQFEKSTLEGTFYDDFINQFPGKISRQKAKDMMFEILFSQNVIHRNFKAFIPYKKEKEILKSVYPFVYKAVHILKEKDHAKLAIFLQRFESSIFIDSLAKDLVNEGIVPLTIHDSVLVESKHQDKAMKIIRNIFLENFGVVPSFHIKPLKK